MTWRDIRAALYDKLGEGAERAGLRERRRKLLSSARGRVLEVGAGTALNVPHYPADLEELVLVEPDDAMAARLRRRLTAARRDARVVSATAESLPFADDSFDTVVVTAVLCAVADLGCSLAEIRRVLKPGGQLLFGEHVRSDDPRLARWQDRLNRPWRVVVGCNCNRRTVEAIRAAEFEIAELERGELPKAPPLARPFVAGRAVSH
ncbi:MAG: class I SAM-dependent methyltransferase [Actinomycetota bacterium]|nr:class I SAM-dependent methyltransferase [Actinomycetota bacterium]